MIMNGRIADTLRAGVERQIATLKSAIRTPTGPFETVDAIVRNARSTVKAITRGAGAGIKLRW